MSQLAECQIILRQFNRYGCDESEEMRNTVEIRPENWKERNVFGDVVVVVMVITVVITLLKVILITVVIVMILITM
jgi:hypothetical protein